MVCPAYLISLLAAVTTVAAAGTDEYTVTDQYTVWSSVIFNRIGDRTPDILNNNTTVLTSLGAQQSFSAGSFFRNLYLATGARSRIYGMKSVGIDSNQVSVSALDEQASVASAQAFVQGLYPPTTLNSSLAAMLDPSNIVSNGSYITAPLNGYQYAPLHISSALDPSYIYLGGNLECPAFDVAVAETYYDPTFRAMQVKSRGVFQKLASFLPDTVSPIAMNFANAYAIYDYISYLAAHDKNVSETLQQPEYIDPNTNQSYLNTLRWLADAQQQYELANLTAFNNLTKSNGLPDQTTGSISTIAGNYLAANILNTLNNTINSRGQYNKLSVMFGDFEPLISLFALMSLSHTSNNFTGLPRYASSAVFELRSWDNTTTPQFPSVDSLYVVFYFRNGTDDTSALQGYSAFQRGPSQWPIAWRDFVDLMSNISLGDIGNWCTQCAAENLFCAAWNPSLTYSTNGNNIYGSPSSTSNASNHGVSPLAAGFIGAVVALVVAALIFALVMFFARIRLYRQPRKTSDLGGFKGSDKLASDRDLTLPKDGAVVTTTNAGADYLPHGVEGGHERTGSWELKQKKAAEAGNGIDHINTAPLPRRSSFEDDEIAVSPFAVPVTAREGV